MTYPGRLILARKIAAAACELEGNSDEYCKFMRDGAYDDNAAVVAALGALKAGERIAANRKSNVVEIAA